MNRWNDSLHGGANSGTLKVISPILSGCDQKWAWSFIRRDSKVWCILKMSIGIELIFYMLTVMQWFLVRPTSYSISLTFKCQSIAGVLVRHLAVAEMILWNRVCLSLRPAICLVVLLELDYYISPNFGMLLDTFTKLCMTEPELLVKTLLAKWVKNRPKVGSFEFKEKFDH